MCLRNLACNSRNTLPTSHVSLFVRTLVNETSHFPTKGWITFFKDFVGVGNLAYLVNCRPSSYRYSLWKQDTHNSAGIGIAYKVRQLRGKNYVAVGAVPNFNYNINLYRYRVLNNSCSGRVPCMRGYRPANVFTVPHLSCHPSVFFLNATIVRVVLSEVLLGPLTLNYTR